MRGEQELRLWIAERSAPVMFALSLTFLVCQAFLVVLWVDVPNFSENARISISADAGEVARIQATLTDDVVDHRIQDAVIRLMFLIWPIVIAESILHWLTRPWDPQMRKYHFFGLLYCICPSLRMCARSPEMGYRMWLPGLSWRQPNKRLRKRLERHFSVPMILIALMIMPVLIIEFFMKSQVAQYAWLRMLLHISTGVIWFAFAAEFILMVSVARKKIKYCRNHWIDLAIILLPLLSFLRSLQVLRATRVLRIQQLTKFARVYRLRGTAVKALRALLLLEIVHRFLVRDVDRAIDKLHRQLGDVEAEAKEIRRKIARLERRRRHECDVDREELEHECDDGDDCGAVQSSDSVDAEIVGTSERN